MRDSEEIAMRKQDIFMGVVITAETRGKEIADEPYLKESPIYYVDMLSINLS